MEMLLLLGVCLAAALLFHALFSVWQSAQADRRADRSVEESHALLVLDALVEERHRILGEMRTVTLDRDTEKIDEAEYTRSYRALERDMFKVLKNLQQIRGDETDLAAADAAIDTVFSDAEARRNTQGWSPAALARHGGPAPTEVQA